MSVFVKICGMTDRAAVRAAIDAEVDAIGFVFHPQSPRNLSPARACELSQDIPTRILRVAVTLHPDAVLWREVETVFRPDALQTDHEDFAWLPVAANIEKWPVLREGGATPDIAIGATYIYEGNKSGAGMQVDWDTAAEIARQGRMILAGGLDADNVAGAVRRVKPFGVDVSSAVESSPGKKDAAMIAAFADAAKSAGIQDEETR